MPSLPQPHQQVQPSAICICAPTWVRWRKSRGHQAPGAIQCAPVTPRSAGSGSVGPFVLVLFICLGFIILGRGRTTTDSLAAQEFLLGRGHNCQNRVAFWSQIRPRQSQFKRQWCQRTKSVRRDKSVERPYSLCPSLCLILSLKTTRTCIWEVENLFRWMNLLLLTHRLRHRPSQSCNRRGRNRNEGGDRPVVSAMCICAQPQGGHKGHVTHALGAAHWAAHHEFTPSDKQANLCWVYSAMPASIQSHRPT